MKNIVLTGFMGTGKTEVGRRLARELGWRFLDTDELIVQEAGMSIPEIFNRSGEKYFRNLERRVIRRMETVKKTVIATGGGAVLDPRNLRSLSRTGVVVCLDAPASVILSRVRGSDRPLLQGSGRKERVTDLLSARRSSYARADRTINTSGKTADQVSSEILRVVRRPSGKSIRVDLAERGYDIRIGTGILERLGREVVSLGVRGKVAVVTNPKVFKLHGSSAVRSLKKAGLDVRVFKIPDGERYKTLASVTRLYDALLKNRFERGSCLVALGGGVIGDLAGFAAATYLRGIRFVQVPTTLAAQVDASIGGKTGVNHPTGKNLIGAFYQPSLVLIDTRVLKTLPKREYVSGIAEVIKYGVIADRAFFGLLEERMQDILNLDEDVLERIIGRSCEIKARVVGEDEHEQNRRRILNYGHTLGHAVESATGYRRFLHGEAVAIGMAFAARLAEILGLSGRETAQRQIHLIESSGLSASLPRIRTADILKSMKLDKKVAGGAIHFVLADRIGHVLVMPVSIGDIRKGIRFLTQGGSR